MCSERPDHGNDRSLTSSIVPGTCFAIALITASLTDGLVRGVAMLFASGAVGVLFPHSLSLLDKLVGEENLVSGKTVQRALVIVLFGTCFFLSYKLFMRGQIINALTSHLLYPRHDGMIADFRTVRGAPARNALGLQLGILSDSVWNKQSTLWYRTQYDQSSNENTYLSIVYQLISTDDTEPFCGIYFDFSPPPPTSYSLSSFSHLSFRVRAAATDTVPRVSVAMHSANIHNYENAFPVYDIPTNDVTSEWVTVDIPFDAFRSPRHVSYQVTLDTTQVYRIALILKGQPSMTIHGRVDIDEMRFH